MAFANGYTYENLREKTGLDDAKFRDCLIRLEEKNCVAIEKKGEYVLIFLAPEGKELLEQLMTR